MPHPDAATITRLYAALDAGDAGAMARCYAEDATFTDPFFRGLRGAEVRGMWDMLTRRVDEMSVVADGIESDGDQGRAHWVATYPFSRTGRTVVNDVRSVFRLRDGLIVAQTDRFDAGRWGAQAFGAPGRMLALPPARALLARSVRADLARHLERHPAPPAG